MKPQGELLLARPGGPRCWTSLTIRSPLGPSPPRAPSEGNLNEVLAFHLGRQHKLLGFRSLDGEDNLNEIISGIHR